MSSLRYRATGECSPKPAMPAIWDQSEGMPLLISQRNQVQTGTWEALKGCVCWLLFELL